ncbi:MAG: NlpC/P60 family protein [Bacillota bacterium]|nr:NlpC/P60 family protein [Bacillota bacterium]
MNKLLSIAKTKVGCGYVWGAQGEILTAEKLQQFKNQFGEEYYIFNDGQGEVDAGKWLGKQVFDCSGLVVWSLVQLKLLQPGQDYDAEAIFNKLCTPAAKEKLVPGDLLFIQKPSGIDHVGIYSGNNQVVEAKSTRSGVVEDAVQDGFNVFGKLNFDLELTGKDILKLLADAGKLDSLDRWNKAIDVIKSVSDNLGDLSVFKYTDILIEKIYEFAKYN